MHMTQKMHFYLSSGFLIFGLFLLMGLFLQNPSGGDINAMFVSETVECEDGTPAGECSQEHIGNMCKITKKGPRLQYSPECYP